MMMKEVEDDCSSDENDEKCDCYEKERYLTRSKQDDFIRMKNNYDDLEKKSLSLSLSANNNNEDELLHVLVTRPEIASRPRDNIIFEGDMDLKTTFETSYEALAKMRLDHWKKYQELKFNGNINEPSINPSPSIGKGRRGKLIKSSSKSVGKRVNNNALNEGEHSRVLMSDDENKNGEQIKRLPVDRREMEFGEHKHKHVSINNNYFINDDDVHDDVKSSKNEKYFSPITPPAFDNEQQTDEINNNFHRASENKTMTTIETISPFNNNYNERDKTFSVKSSPIPQSTKMINSNSNYNTSRIEANELSQSPIIDTDLSTLFFYNANMNRLDTVGLRRRSKYRPSTTLRSGNRGMFGDQEEIKQDVKNNYSKQQQPQNLNLNHVLVEEQEEEESKSKRSTPQGAEKLDRSEQTLSARNLGNSKQSNHLVYSDLNLHVDSKRKVYNNVNMIDHIKEQNVEQIQQQNIVDSNDINFMLKQNMDDLKLMQAEEEAAFNEIKRFNSPAPSQSRLVKIDNNPSLDYQQKLDSINNNIVDNNDKQSKSQKNQLATCQNQNFDIFKCKYLEPKINDYRIKKQNNINKRQSPLFTPNSNNLFRESPDFILTTGKYLYEEANQHAAENYQREQEVATKNRSAIDPRQQLNADYSNEEPTVHDDDNKQMCQILNLDKNFRYVGSLSGHKYFAEK